jgi:hypothetical protein
MPQPVDLAWVAVLDFIRIATHRQIVNRRGTCPCVIVDGEPH